MDKVLTEMEHWYNLRQRISQCVTELSNMSSDRYGSDIEECKLKLVEAWRICRDVTGS